MQIQILLFPGFDELDGVGPYEVFRMAAKAGAPCEVKLVTLNGTPQVRAAHGLEISVPEKMNLDAVDLLLVPGGGWADRAPEGVRAEVERGEIAKALRDACQSGKTIAAVCTGALLLAHAALLNGRPCTTHASALEDLRAAGGKIIGARVVDDGQLLTCGGVTSGIDLALWIVEKYFGALTARTVATRLEYSREKDVYRSS
ncbi:MAG: DJ-1/PfpI family protein [bacterium]